MSRIPLREVSGIVGAANLQTSKEDLYCYSYDASKLKAIPEAVAFPGSPEEISELVKLANREGFPIYARGAGSGMVGASVPWMGGLVLALTRLSRILEIDAENMVAVVEPAVVTATFQKAAARRGLFYPPDPASLQFSTLGGNVAMCAGGPRAVKYGVTRDYVLGLEVVLPTGPIIHTGGRTMKGVVGYDLTRLMVGSEGTLGIFTKIILRVLPAPEGQRTLMAVFPKLNDAATAVSAIIKHKIIPSTMELMDQETIRVVENYLHCGLPTGAEALLLIEVDGDERTLAGDAENIQKICTQSGASEIQTAESESDRERLWQARRAVSPALGQIKPGKINEDVVVPRSKIPALIKAIGELSRSYNLIIVCFGHAGDGNIHTNIMLDRNDPGELQRAENAVQELFKLVLHLGGTISGEHGIGITKSPFLQWETGPDGWVAMQRIKQALDPLDILNPGKIFVPNRAFFRSF